MAKRGTASILQSLRISALLLVGLSLSPNPLLAQSTYRDITGTVTDPQYEPLRGAVVKIHDDGTLSIRSYITDKDGRYSFKRLSGEANYTIWGTFRTIDSPKHTVTSFDTNKAKVIDLVIALH